MSHEPELLTLIMSPDLFIPKRKSFIEIVEVFLAKVRGDTNLPLDFKFLGGMNPPKDFKFRRDTNQPIYISKLLS